MRTRCSLGEIAPLKYGKSLPSRVRIPGNVPIVSSGGTTGSHNTALVADPCIVIGRKVSIGTVFLVNQPSFPIDTTFYTLGSEHVYLRFLYYLLSTLPLAEMNNDSAVPGLNRHQTEALQVMLPELEEQQAIAATLGALDDKIESNRRIIELIDSLQATLWKQSRSSAAPVEFLQYFSPHLGGTPVRSNPENWRGYMPWVSVKDVTSAEDGMILETSEHISADVANSVKRLSPLPIGSVFLTARGTVGKIATNLIPCAINQSAYAFAKRDSYIAVHRLMVSDAVSILRARAHGSTFPAITIRDFEGINIPNPASASIKEISEDVELLEQHRWHSAKENLKLRGLRDALLPELMSGRIRVRDAKDTVESVVDSELPEVNRV